MGEFLSTGYDPVDSVFHPVLRDIRGFLDVMTRRVLEWHWL